MAIKYKFHITYVGLTSKENFGFGNHSWADFCTSKWISDKNG
jgi:hypothetical protein